MLTKYVCIKKTHFLYHPKTKLSIIMHKIILVNIINHSYHFVPSVNTYFAVIQYTLQHSTL